MSDPVKKASIAAQYGQYVESKKQSRRVNEGFARKISKRLEITKKEFDKSNAVEKRVRRGSVPNLGHSKRITKSQAKRLAQYAPYIENAAKKYNVPVEVICGVMLQESGAQSHAVSHCGAKGLMQLMPATARRFGVKNPLDPAQNIDGGTAYLSWLIRHFKGDLQLAIAAYNAGEKNIEKYGNKIPPFHETRNYVPAVLGYTQSMIKIFAERMATSVPSYARRA